MEAKMEKIDVNVVKFEVKVEAEIGRASCRERVFGYV